MNVFSIRLEGINIPYHWVYTSILLHLLVHPFGTRQMFFLIRKEYLLLKRQNDASFPPNLCCNILPIIRKLAYFIKNYIHIT